MKILYFGIYSPNYSRTRVLMKGLRQNKVEVVECNDHSPSVLKYIKLSYKYLTIKKDFDMVLVAFPGYQTTILIKLLMLLNPFKVSKPIVFDSFFSVYNMAVEDRKVVKSTSLKAKYYWYLDKLSCWWADRVLLDTNANIEFFIKKFNFPREKFIRVFVGTDGDFFYPRSVAKPNGNFLVHFHGNFIPLQGAEHIIKSAHVLRNEDVRFQIIGKGQEYPRVKKIADELNLTNITWIDRVLYEELPDYINRADVCLGGFGDTEKANIVSLNKLFEYMACGKAIITGEGASSLELLENGESAIFCRRANPRDLADKILALKNDLNMIGILVQNARKKFEESYTPQIIAKELLRNLTRI